jgi:hypothetical protein
MKTMTCKQLGGPETCDKEFHAETFDEMKEKSMKHAHEMHEKGDEAHVKVMNEMKEKMKDSEAMQKWMDERKAEFDDLSTMHKRFTLQSNCPSFRWLYVVQRYNNIRMCLFDLQQIRRMWNHLYLLLDLSPY